MPQHVVAAHANAAEGASARNLQGGKQAGESVTGSMTQRIGLQRTKLKPTQMKFWDGNEPHSCCTACCFLTSACESSSTAWYVTGVRDDISCWGVTTVTLFQFFKVLSTERGNIIFKDGSTANRLSNMRRVLGFLTISQERVCTNASN